MHKCSVPTNLTALDPLASPRPRRSDILLQSILRLPVCHRLFRIRGIGRLVTSAGKHVGPRYGNIHPQSLCHFFLGDHVDEFCLRTETNVSSARATRRGEGEETNPSGHPQAINATEFTTKRKRKAKREEWQERTKRDSAILQLGNTTRFWIQLCMLVEVFVFHITCLKCLAKMSFTGTNSTPCSNLTRISPCSSCSHSSTTCIRSRSLR